MSPDPHREWVFSGSELARKELLSFMSEEMRLLLRALHRQKEVTLWTVQRALSHGGITGTQYMAITLYWAQLDEEAAKVSQAIPSKTEGK